MNELMKKILKKINPPSHFDIVIADNLPNVYHSPMAVMHIFENLIENSIKYSNTSEPEISIQYEQQDNTHIFEVEDNGKGVPKELHQTIFNLFQQGNQNEIRAVKSVGVGLATVNKLVKLMGGTINVDSEVEKGTKFTLKFPKTTNL